MFKPLLMREKIQASAWCEAHLVLPRATSPAHPGRLSFAAQPYLREIVDCALNPSVQTVVVSGGSQIGKTTMLLAMFAAWVGLEPTNLLWAMKNADQMRDFARRRLIEFVRANPILARHIPLDPACVTAQQISLDHMDVKLIGAGSPANMSSIAVGAVIADEAAKYEWYNKDEAPPLRLLQERTKSFPRRFHVFASTPTTVENDFWQLFASGEMMQFYVPCPYCGGYQVLHWSKKRIRFDRTPEGNIDLDLAERTTRYVCDQCGREIWDDCKSAMIEQGEWRRSEWLAKAFGDEKVVPSSSTRSYHISSMYSPFLTWGAYTRQYLEAMQQLNRSAALQNLVNSWAALPYEQYEAQVNEDDILALCGDYQRGSVPVDDYYYISVGYDPGGDATHWVACAVGRGGEMWVIDWGVLLQYRTLSHQTEAGYTIIDSPGIAPHYKSLHWGDHAPSAGWVDSGYQTEEIYDECAMLEPLGELTPTKGTSARQGVWFRRPAAGKWAELSVVTYVDHHIKTSLYGDTISRHRAPALHLPRRQDVTSDLLRGLSGQRLVLKQHRLEWKRVDQDHYGDCIKLSRVGWWVLAHHFEEATAVQLDGEDDQIAADAAL